MGHSRALENPRPGREQSESPCPIPQWLADPGSLTARLRLYGAFRVVPRDDRIIRPTLAEQQLLGHIGRQRALVREVTLLVDDQPMVEARSVLPLASLRGPNRGLAHMGSRSLGSELYRRPMARRDRVWVRHGAAPSGQTPCWGRQSRFIKRGRPLLVAEHFLPALWRRVEDMDR